MDQQTFLRLLAATPLSAEASAIYNEVKPHSILYVAQLKQESNFGREGIAPANKNPTGLRPRGGDGFMRFQSWAAAAREWYARVTDPNYAYADTQTVEEYVHTYAPASDGNNEAAYVAAIKAYAKEYSATASPPTTTITFGRVPKPSMIEMICDKPREGAGFDRVAPRKIVGTCNHRTEGRDTPRSVHNLFSTGGERQFDALTDYVIGTDGTIGHLNDENGTRAGWANGGSDGLEGDGPNFVQKFTVVGINSRLASIEHCGLGTDPVASPQFDASARLNAWLFDKCKVRWDSFPINQTYGVVTQMEHWEFATKGCPGTQFRSHTTDLHEAIRGLLKSAQTGSSTGPTPPPVPVEPGHEVHYPNGMDEDLARELYHTFNKHLIDGRVQVVDFDPKNAVCLAWLTRGAREMVYPQADTWWQLEDGNNIIREVAVFDNGWVLWRPNARAAWRWL